MAAPNLRRQAQFNGDVDPRLLAIIEQASQYTPYDVELRSGFRSNDSRQHGRHNALDINLIDRASGQRLPNYQDGTNFRAYEEFAQAARAVQMAQYPELKGAFRWGGYFGQPGGEKVYGAFDLMHFDLAGEKLGMAGGSWEGGLAPHMQRVYSVNNSVGMGQNAKSRDYLATLTPGQGIGKVAPIPKTMSSSLAERRLTPNAPPTTALGYAPNAGTSTLGQPSVPLYREGWSDAYEMSTARPGLSASTGAQGVQRAATDAYRSVQGKPSTSRPTADQIYGGVIPAGGLDPAQLYSAAPGKQDRLRPQAPATPYDPYAGIIPAGGLNPAYVYAAAPGKTNRLRPPPSAPAQVVQASTGPVFGTVDGDITGTIRQVQLPQQVTQTAPRMPVTQTASGVPITQSIQGTDPTQVAPQPKEMSPALRAARERLQAARDARQGAQTSWFDTRREPKSGTTTTTRTDFGFEPVPQGGRPNIDIPGEATTIKWGQAIPRAEPPAPPPSPPPKPLVAPQPMPRPADRMPVQAQPQTLPQGQNWMDAAAAGIPRMVEQVNAAMPKGNTEPSWYELQTGNPGSRGPTAVQILGMINTNRLMNSLGSYQGGPPTISTTYRRRNVEPAGWPSPTDYAEYARVANSLASMQHHRLGGPSLGTFTVDGRTMDLRPGIQDFNNYEGRSISTPDGSPLWSYN